MNVLIWWTNQEQAESITEEMLESLPDYVQSEFDSRYGRPGRGRLWIHPDLPQVGVDPWPQTDLAEELCDSGGIVFKEEDLKNMSGVPGVITNLELVHVRESGPDDPFETAPHEIGPNIPFESVLQDIRREFNKDHHVVEIEMEPTNRGFKRGEFTDLYGCRCSIQDSSLANQPAIWLGVNDAAPERLIPGQGWTEVEFPKDTLFHTRMHLTVDHAKTLVKVLQRFIDTGSIGE